MEDSLLTRVFDAVFDSFTSLQPEKKKKSHPRGCVYLAGSITSPSDEDSQTFTVNSASGECFKLRAVDAKERQFWVDKLRQVTLDLENRIASESSKPQVLSSLNDVRDTLLHTQKSQVHLVEDIEKFTCTDEKLLLLKATSQSALMSLEQSFAILLAIHHHRY